MSDTRLHIRAANQALDDYLKVDQNLERLQATFSALLDHACAAAEDDLAECAEQALAWLKEIDGSDPVQATGALKRVKEMLNTLLAAYEGEDALGAAAPAELGLSGRPIPPVEVPPMAPPAVPELPTNNPAPVGGLGHGDPGGAEDSERDPEILNEFLVESTEHLTEAEQHLLALDAEPDNVEALRSLFRGFHTIKGLAGFLDFPGIEVLAHATEDVLAAARDSRGMLPTGATDVILESVDRLLRAMEDIRVGASGNGPLPDVRPATPELLERLRTLAGGEEVHLGGSVPRVAAISDPEVHGAEQDLETEGDEGEQDGDGPELDSERPRPAAPQARPSGGQDSHGMLRAKRESIRVDAERLDRLVDMVGELVITESMVTRSVDGLAGNVQGLGRHITRLDKITRELHELAGSLRLVPVRATFRKMARLARDVARKSGKRVVFKVAGEDAELDKTLVDRIGDPLVHMVRNAIDHGLESDQVARARLGKPKDGQVVLRALHRGGSVYIEVEDDGRGLDPAKILSRAVERGLVREGEQLNKRDIIRLICEPGFSTADKVTSISGRGVGMDVVRQQIESMNGSLEVTSEVGKGTCFSMRLPLTLAVIDGMVMRLGEDRYVVPTLSVVRLVKATDAQMATVMEQGEVLRLGEELVPVVRPKDLFGIEGGASSSPLVVVVEVERGKVAMVVDELLGQQQVVIKSLGEGLGDIPGLAGCAIMPDGRVGIVLDVGGIVRNHQAQEQILEAV